jgi:hypothetical protein
MAIKTTDDFPIKRAYYYIIDFRRMMYPVLRPVYFVNYNAAKRVLISNMPNRNIRRFFSIYSGKTIKNLKLNYIIGEGNYLHLGGKYPYPHSDMTKQEKKSFRTLLRRRLRRMGLQTNNKVKYKYHEKASKVKYLPNRQKVANNKNSDAKVFQLDRKPRYYYYIILQKCLTSKSGKLFKVRAIRCNIKTGNWKKVTIYTNRNDIFFPELLGNLNKMPNGQEAVRAYKEYCQRKQNAPV